MREVATRQTARSAEGVQSRQAFSLETPPITLQPSRKALVVGVLAVIEGELEF